MKARLIGKPNLRKPASRGRAVLSGPAATGLLPLPLLHVIGGSGSVLDEVVIFGGILLVIGVLVFLSWRAGRDRKRREGSRRRRTR